MSINPSEWSKSELFPLLAANAKPFGLRFPSPIRLAPQEQGFELKGGVGQRGYETRESPPPSAVVESLLDIIWMLFGCFPV